MGSKIFWYRLIVVLFFSALFTSVNAGIFNLFEDDPKFIVINQDANFSLNNLCDLNDVSCSSLANSNVLIFNSSNLLWENGVQTGGSGGSGTGGVEVAFTDANLSNGILTVNHNLDLNYVLTEIYDNTEEVVWADNITNVNTNTTDINLSSFGTLTGIWHTRVIASSQSTAGTGFTKTFTTSDLTNGVLRVQHDQNKSAPTVSVYDDTNQLIIPDNVLDLNNSAIDLNVFNFETITGTWIVRVGGA